MAECTTNYGLKKPDPDEFADVQDLNKNFDKIDEVLHNNSAARFFGLPSLGDPAKQILILTNPTGESKRALIASTKTGLKTTFGNFISPYSGGKVDEITIPANGAAVTWVYNGQFAMVHYGEDRCHSESITYFGYDEVNGWYVYEIDTAGVMQVDTEAGMVAG